VLRRRRLRLSLGSASADGGVCDTLVTFADGSTETVSFDWGAAHPGQCCGTSYDTNGGVITVHGDASGH
jgi:hypothetical protein